MSLKRLRDFVEQVTAIHQSGDGSEQSVAPQAHCALRALVAKDDWLPDDLAKPHAQYYQQYLLHCDALRRFSVVSFVWGPGQGTPIHDHTVWGLIGMLRGAEVSQRFDLTTAGIEPVGPEELLEPGTVSQVSPALGQDIHRVRNAKADAVSISIHLYGGNIGEIERHVFDPSTGSPKSFVSGYVKAALPNIWLA